MARRAAVAHKKRLDAHHKRHKKRLLKVFHKIKSHPGCYKPGYTPRRGRVPKSLPRKPSGLNAKGSGLWDHVKKAWHWVTGQAKKHGKALYEEGKKHAIKHGKVLLEEGKRRATEYGKQALARGSDWAKGQAQAVGQNMRNKVEGYVKKADDKIRSVADKVDSKLSKYTGGVGAMPGKTLKKGAGLRRAKYRVGPGGVSAKQREARRRFLDKYVRS
jgi:hypothetical protein